MKRLDYIDIYEDTVTENELRAFIRTQEGREQAQGTLKEWRAEEAELIKEYNNGDPDIYDPSWYDSYIYPISFSCGMLDDLLEELSDAEED